MANTESGLTRAAFGFLFFGFFLGGVSLARAQSETTTISAQDGALTRAKSATELSPVIPNALPVVSSGAAPAASPAPVFVPALPAPAVVQPAKPAPEPVPAAHPWRKFWLVILGVAVAAFIAGFWIP